MEIHQLRYFVAISDYGSFSKAAEKCFVSQPALSQQIRKLETEIGHTLIDRLGRRVVLTASGEIFLNHAKSVLDELIEAKKEIEFKVTSGCGKLSIGIIPTLAPFVLSETIQGFMKEYPETNLTVHENTSANLIEMLYSGELDTIYSGAPLDEKQISTELVVTEPLLISTRRNGVPSGNGKKVTITDYEKTPYIALSDVHCLSGTIKSFCAQHNFKPTISCHTAQLSTVQKLVSDGFGVSLLPKLAASTDTMGTLKYLPLQEKLERQILAGWH